MNQESAWWQAVTARGHLVKSCEGRYKFHSEHDARHMAERCGEAYEVAQCVSHSGPVFEHEGKRGD